jgi:N,N'-diacetyllegionaminate synthase
MNKKTIIIAEAGVNHNGSMDLAIKLIDVAAESGADYVKFQTFKTNLLVTSSAEMAGYQKKIIDSGESQAEMLRKLELSQDSFAILAKHAKKKGIGFLSTPFDIESAITLNNIGMDFYKVSSGDLTNTPFLREIAKFGKPIILSTGMATLGEVERAVATLENSLIPIKDISILHCTTEYPAPIDEVNLSVIETLKTAFPGAVIGYSDHTDGIDISIAAAALGAKVIEKHFTLDKKMIGPDHQASLEPDDLSEMVKSIRRVDQAMGNGRKIPTKSEVLNIKIARKSIVAQVNIARGAVLTAQNIGVKRPGDGISPERWDEVVGTVAQKDYSANEPI